MKVTARTRWLLRFALCAAVTFLALCGAEVFVTVNDTDWRLVEEHLYRQGADINNHVQVNDPQLLYRLRPDSVFDYESNYGPYTVHVNTLGYRGAEVESARAPGTYRILCVGGSNVYGAAVNDDQTWPARLEHRLVEAGVPAEVWNLGVSGYTGTQMAALAREAIEAHDPDLVIVAPSNMGPRPLLAWVSPRPLFRDHPICWKYLFGLAETPGPIRRAALRHWRLYRLAELALAQRGGEPKPNLWAISAETFEVENLEAVHTLVSEYEDRVRFCGFILPAARPAATLGYTREELALPMVKYGPIRGFVPQLELLQRYTDGLPTLVLDGEDLPDEYRELHPPPDVLDWYGENISAWLVAEGLVPSPVEAPQESRVE